MKPLPVTPPRALGGEQQHAQQRELLREVIGVLVAWAMNTAAIVR